MSQENELTVIYQEENQKKRLWREKDTKKNEIISIPKGLRQFCSNKFLISTWENRRYLFSWWWQETAGQNLWSVWSLPCVHLGSTCLTDSAVILTAERGPQSVRGTPTDPTLSCIGREEHMVLFCDSSTSRAAIYVLKYFVDAHTGSTDHTEQVLQIGCQAIENKKKKKRASSMLTKLQALTRG